MPKRAKDLEVPWFPGKGTEYLRARVVHVDGRYCVLCRRSADVFIDVKRGRTWWQEAFPICEGCAEEIPRVLKDL